MRASIVVLSLALLLLAPRALAQIELTPGETATCPDGWFSGVFGGPDTPMVYCDAFTPTPEPTDEPTATPFPTAISTALPSSTPTNTTLPTPTRTSTSVPTSAPAATATALPTAAPTTITFNDITNPNRNLTGQYPAGVINWGASGWWIGSAYGQFTTNSIGLQNAQTTTASFTFVSPRILISLRANNVGTSSTTLTISCTGNPTVSQLVTVGQVVTVVTGWTNICTTVTFANSNAWNNDYDDFVISAPGPTPTAISVGPTATAVVGGPCTGTIVGSGGAATIAAGMASAPVDGTVCIRAGTYPEQVEIPKRLTLQAYGDGPVWIDGTCTNDNAVKIAATAASSSVVRGLGMRNTVGAGIKIDQGVSSITIDGNTIQNFDCTNAGPEYRAGVAVWLGGSGQRITSNTIKRRTAGALTGGLSDCVWFKSTTANPSGGGHYIANNVLVGCWDGIGGETEGDSRGSFDRNTTIEGNTITDCEDDGIQSDGGNLNNVIRNNVIRRCALGISNAPNLTGPLTIEGNDIREGRLGSYGNLACFKVGAGGSAIANYTNNTCVISALVAVGWSQTNPGNNPIVARGNQINVTNYVLEFSSNLPSGTSFDGDCLYTSDPGRFVKWNGAPYGSLAAFRGLGHEATGTSSPSCGN